MCSEVVQGLLDRIRAQRQQLTHPKYEDAHVCTDALAAPLLDALQRQTKHDASRPAPSASHSALALFCVLRQPDGDGGSGGEEEDIVPATGDPFESALVGEIQRLARFVRRHAEAIWRSADMASMRLAAVEAAVDAPEWQAREVMNVESSLSDLSTALLELDRLIHSNATACALLALAYDTRASLPGDPSDPTSHATRAFPFSAPSNSDALRQQETYESACAAAIAWPGLLEASVLLLSRMHVSLRRVRVSSAPPRPFEEWAPREAEGPGAEQPTTPTAARKSTKYWIHPSNVLAFKLAVIPHMPLQEASQGELGSERDASDSEAAFADQDNSHSSIAGGRSGALHTRPWPGQRRRMPACRDSEPVSVVYFDDEDFWTFSQRTAQVDGAQVVRVAWCGERTDSLDQVMSLEWETHREKWAGEQSLKWRETLRQAELVAFLQHGTLPATARSCSRRREFFGQVGSLLASRGLAPSLRTTFQSTTFREDGDGRGALSKVSLDTDLFMVREMGRGRTRGDWCRNLHRDVPPGDIVSFPYGVAEIKLRDRAANPGWVEKLEASGMIVKAEKFSKFVHGSVMLNPGRVPHSPWWFTPASLSGLAARPLTITDLAAANGFRERHQSYFNWQAPLPRSRDGPVSNAPGTPPGHFVATRAGGLEGLSACSSPALKPPTAAPRPKCGPPAPPLPPTPDNVATGELPVSSPVATPDSGALVSLAVAGGTRPLATSSPSPPAGGLSPAPTTPGESGPIAVPISAPMRPGSLHPPSAFAAQSPSASSRQLASDLVSLCGAGGSFPFHIRSGPPSMSGVTTPAASGGLGPVPERGLVGTPGFSPGPRGAGLQHASPPPLPPVALFGGPGPDVYDRGAYAGARAHGHAANVPDAAEDNGAADPVGCGADAGGGGGGGSRDGKVESVPMLAMIPRYDSLTTVPTASTLDAAEDTPRLAGTGTLRLDSSRPRSTEPSSLQLSRPSERHAAPDAAHQRTSSSTGSATEESAAATTYRSLISSVHARHGHTLSAEGVLQPAVFAPAALDGWSGHARDALPRQPRYRRVKSMGALRRAGDRADRDDRKQGKKRRGVRYSQQSCDTKDCDTKTLLADSESASPPATAEIAATAWMPRDSVYVSWLQLSVVLALAAVLLVDVDSAKAYLVLRDVVVDGVSSDAETACDTRCRSRQIAGFVMGLTSICCCLQAGCMLLAERSPVVARLTRTYGPLLVTGMLLFGVSCSFMLLFVGEIRW